MEMPKLINWIYEIIKNAFIERKLKSTYQLFKEYTMIPEEIFIGNLKLTLDYSKIKGCYVECGVWKGGMSAAMAFIFPKRHYTLLDSFEGLPPAKSIDGESAIKWQKNKENPHYFNNCTAEETYAEEAMSKTKAKYRIIKGWFKNTLPDLKFDEKIALLRLDADWYESTIDCLTYLYPHVENGGIIILDDYHVWDGCSKAVHDYLSKQKVASKIMTTKEGVCYIIKRE